MLTVPLGMIGAFLLLWITGNTINIFSIIGMIMGEGLVAKSGILLVDYTNTLRERGMGRTEALQEAVRVRLRPILMTSCTMIFGMLPLALKLEAGAETRAPMAIVVIGALLSSTLLTLVVVPALYTVVDDIQTKLFHGGRKSAKAWRRRCPRSGIGHRRRRARRRWPPPPSQHHRRKRNGAHAGNGAANGQAVPLNIADRGLAYLVRAALPGVKQEDVQVAINGHTLTIRGREPERRRTRRTATGSCESTRRRTGSGR